MANPRKPDAIKKALGTDRADRDYGEMQVPEAENLAPPDSLVNDAAVEMWGTVARILGPLSMISDADLPALVHLCNLHGRVMEMWSDGKVPTASLLTQLRLMMTEFGITPASRSRPTPLKGDDDDDDPAERHFTGPQVVNG